MQPSPSSQYVNEIMKSVKVHFDIHHLGIKFQCDQCTFQATNKNRLKHHIELKHEGKGWPCDICGFMANNKKTLESHKERHNSDRVRYPCDKCDETLCSPEVLRRHKRVVHQGIMA